MPDQFLRRKALTQHFSLGAPRHLLLTEEGDKLFFIRSLAGDDPRGCLFTATLKDETYQEELLVDPSHIEVKGDLPPVEQARRERARESGSGIVAFSIDRRGKQVTFALAGDIYVVATKSIAKPTCIVEGEGAFDPQLSPDGAHVAYVANGALRIASARSDGRSRTLAEDEDPNVTWGQADFIAAEEMDRLRGFWWAPDSQKLTVQRVDNRSVKEWYIAHPAQPEVKPTPVRYPAAGTPNAKTSLAIVPLDGEKIEVEWNSDQFEYLVDVSWRQKQPLVTVQSRDQKTVQVYNVDDAGRITLQDEQHDPHWVELTDSPWQLADGSLVQIVDQDGRRLKLGDDILTPPSLILRAIHSVLSDDSVVFSAYEDDPTSWSIWEVKQGQTPLKVTTTTGIYGAIAKGQTLLLRQQDMTRYGAITALYRKKDGQWHEFAKVPNLAETPPFLPSPTFHKSGAHNLVTALLLPEKYNGDAPLPVLLDPYGGPHAQRVLAAQAVYLDAQWWANQGFAVVITDGRGTPGRGSGWEKAIAGDLIGPILEDQVTALQAVAAKDARLDLSRVGIRGWSFGGYLAAYAVVRRPDMFHAAIAGAPVTDWRLYDAHYSERYLGDPKQNKNAYDACSLLQVAAQLSRPLMLIHGFADDNVMVAHTLQFSGALLTAGKPHQMLPLSDATHMASGAVLAENLEKLQLDFLQKQLL